MRKITPDKEKSKSLLKMAEKSLERLKETDKKKYPSQTLRDYYDILRQLMEGLASLEGVKSQGKGAHKKLIDWVCEEYNLKESERHFLQKIRKYRNRIEYEGFSIDFSYLERNETRIDDMIQIFKEKLRERVY